MAPLAQNGGPQRKSWIALAIAALFVIGFVAAGAFGDAGGGATSSFGSSEATTVSASGTTDTGTTAPTSTDTTSTATPVDTASTSTSTSTATATDTTATSTPTDTTSVSTPTTTSSTTPALAPTVKTDKVTYQPGGTVAVSGSNWTPSESVHLKVADDGTSGWTYNKDLLAAADGTVRDAFALPSSFASSFTVTATDGAGATASAKFSDAFSGAPVPYIVTFAGGTSGSAETSEIAAAGGTNTGSIPPLNMHSITFPSGGAQAGVSALEANSDVLRVEQDRSRDTAGAPDDPRYLQQWSLPRIGWDQVYGSVTPGGSATVAVLDTGVDASHPDLAGKVVAGTNAISGSGDGESDPNGHGTGMAGIVAAATNNGTGIAGIAYAGVQIMPVTVLNAQGLGYDSDVISGVVYAVQHHADVILMSFSNPGYSDSLQQAIDWAWSQGAVLVAATGNDGSSTVNYPAGDRGVIGVGNTDSNDNLNSSSNIGADVFLAAPGTDVLSTAAGGGYSSVTGTSAAAAAVAGAAALIKASSVGASNGVIVNRLAESADPVGTATQTGNGRLNIARAIDDSSSASVEPAGAAPNGDGGPLVGPYKAATNGTITGTVTDSVTHLPIGGASVSCAITTGGCNNAISTTTAANGTYSLQIQYGGGTASASVTAAASSYASQTVAVAVANNSGSKDFALVPATAPTSLSVASASGTYGGSVSLAATLTSSGGCSVTARTIAFTLNGSSVGSATTNASGVASLSGVSFGTTAANTYPTGVGASFAAVSGCGASTGSNSLTVGKAPLTVTADNKSRTYGDANPALTLQISGFVNGETSSVLTTQPTCTTAATASSSVSGSPYAVSCSGAAAANYSFTYVNGQLTVTPALLTVTANNQSRAYGDANPALTFQTSGFKNGETSSVLTTQPTCSTTATAGSSVSGSPYAISCSGAAAANYSFSYVNGQLTVTPALLTVTANNQSRPYGDANPILSFQISGFKNGETSTVLTTQPTCNTTATAASSVSGSPYAITCAGAAAANYSFTYANGQLTVTKAPLTVRADDQARAYGAPNPALTFQISGFKNGDTSAVLTTQPTCSTAATTSSSVSGSPYAISCSGAAAANYSFSYVNGQLTVTRAALTVTADNQTRAYGDSNPTLTFQVAGFKNGETASALTTQPGCSTVATAASSVAGSPYAISCSGGAAANYSFSYVDGRLTVTRAPLTVTADNQSQLRERPADGDARLADGDRRRPVARLWGREPEPELPGRGLQERRDGERVVGAAGLLDGGDGGEFGCR